MTNSFLFFGVFTSVLILVKSIKKCDRESARIRTHGQRQTGFIICSVLYAITMGQIIMGHLSYLSRDESRNFKISTSVSDDTYYAMHHELFSCRETRDPFGNCGSLHTFAMVQCRNFRFGTLIYHDNSQVITDPADFKTQLNTPFYVSCYHAITSGFRSCFHGK